MQRGRKSSASTIIPLDVTGARPKLSPPSILSTVERTLFTELANGNQHLTAPDAALLAGYVQALNKMQRLAKKSDIAAWEKATRVALALGRSLRLTPQSTVRPETVGRHRADQPRGPAPWDRERPVTTEEEEE
jgi:hypothetical protein